MIIEELNLDSDEETLVSKIERDDVTEEHYGDTFYSYPYYSVNNFDYQFRATLSGDFIKLEEVKCNEEDLNSIESTKILKEYPEINFDKGFQMIQNGVDLRTGEKIVIESETINYTIEKGDNAEKILENNKRVVLLELYNSITE